MLIKRTSPISGKINALEIDVTEEQMNAWKRGVVIQNAMPNLTVDEREFIQTGIPKDEWDELMKDEE